MANDVDYNRKPLWAEDVGLYRLAADKLKPAQWKLYVDIDSVEGNRLSMQNMKQGLKNPAVKEMVDRTIVDIATNDESWNQWVTHWKMVGSGTIGGGVITAFAGVPWAGAAVGFVATNIAGAARSIIEQTDGTRKQQIMDRVEKMGPLYYAAMNKLSAEVNAAEMAPPEPGKLPPKPPKADTKGKGGNSP